MKELKDRVLAAREHARLTQVQLAQRAGIAQQTLADIEGGRHKSSRKLTELAIAAGVSPVWLATGNGDMIVSAELRENPPAARALRPIMIWDNVDDLPENEYVIVPRLLLKFSAGKGNGPTAEPDPEIAQGQAFRTGYIRRKRLSPKGLMSAYANGDSMEPRIHDGDSLLIDTAQRDIIDGKVYAMAWGDDQELKVKRLYKLPGGGLLIRSDNRERYPEISVDVAAKSTVSIIGRVVLVSGDV